MNGRDFFVIGIMVVLCGLVAGAIFNLHDYNIPPDFDGNMQAVACDIDSDGDQDIVTACGNDVIRFYVNTGMDENGDGFPEFMFEDYRSDFTMGYVDSMASSLCIVDANADGSPDIYFGLCRDWGHGGLDNVLLVNDDDGYFLANRTCFPLKHDRTREVLACDFNNDGYEDIFVANGSRSGGTPFEDLSYPLINTGEICGDGLYRFYYPGDSAGFEDRVWSDSFVTNGVVVFDYDGNGYEDVLLLNQGQSCRLFLNFCPANGDCPVFHDSTSALPIELRGIIVYECAATGDMDGDGDVDLLVAPLMDSLMFFVNYPGGYLPEPLISRMWGFRRDVVIEDINDDGFTDFVTAEQIMGVYMNSFATPGNFAEHTFDLVEDNHNFEQYTVFDVAPGDFDGDSCTDFFLCCSYEQNRIYYWRDGYFFNGTFSRYPADASDDYQVYPFDIDSDGDADIFFGGRGDSLHFYENVGDSFIAKNANINNQGWANHNDSRVRGIAFADITDDGLIDFVCCGNDADNLVINTHLYINIGESVFRDSTRLNIPWLVDKPGKDVYFVKANPDNRPDILLLSANADQDELYINQGDTDGDGVHNFVRLTTALPPMPGFSTMSDTADVNGDGFTDVIVGKNNLAGDQNYLLICNGDGTYSDSSAAMFPPSALTDDMTWAARFGDADGDGHDDILIVNHMQQNRLFIYDVDSVGFTDATDSLPEDAHLPNSDAKFADVDADSDTDIILVVNIDQATWDWRARHPYVYINTGAGRFVDSTEAFISTVGSLNEINWSVGVADFDLDGYPDFVTQADGQSRLYWNDYAEVVSVAEHPPVRPEVLEIRAWPNPFNSAVTISVEQTFLSVHDDDHTEMSDLPIQTEIFDISGRRVFVISTERSDEKSPTYPQEISRPCGRKREARNDNISEFVWRPDASLGCGVYLVRVSIPGDKGLKPLIATKRVVYLK